MATKPDARPLTVEIGEGTLTGDSLDAYIKEAQRILDEKKRKEEQGLLSRGVSEAQRLSSEAYDAILASGLPGRLPLADAFQAANPFLWGAVGEAASTSPRAEKAALDLENRGGSFSDFASTLGLALPSLGAAGALPLALALTPPTRDSPTAAALTRFAAGQLPTAALGALGAVGAGAKAGAAVAPKAASSLAQALRAAAPAIARGAGAGAGLAAGFGAASGLLGDPEGRRVEGAVERATDPLMLALGALGGAAGPLGGAERALRAGRSAVRATPVVAPPDFLDPRTPPEARVAYIDAKIKELSASLPPPKEAPPKVAPEAPPPAAPDLPSVVDPKEGTVLGKGAAIEDKTPVRGPPPPLPADKTPVIPAVRAKHDARLQESAFMRNLFEERKKNAAALAAAELKSVGAAAKGPGGESPAASYRTAAEQALEKARLEKLTPEQRAAEMIAANEARIAEIQKLLAKKGALPAVTPEAKVAANNARIAEIEAQLNAAKAAPVAKPGDVTPTALQVTVREAAKNIPEAAQTPSGPPKQPIIPPDVVPSASAEDAMRLGQQLLRAERSPGLLSRLYKQVVDPAYRSPAHAAEAIRGHRAAYAAAETTMRQLVPALRKAYRQAGDSGRKVIDAYMKQMDLTPEEFVKRGGAITPLEALPEEWRNLFEQSQRMQGYMRDKLIEAGYFSPEQLELIIAREKADQVWLHREYRAFVDNKWTPPKDVYEKAFTKMTEAAAGKLTPDEVRADLHALLTPEPGVSRETAFQRSRFANSVLKGRQDLPFWLRDFLGEIKDPNFRVAVSAAETERLFAQHAVSETYTAPEYKGTVWDDRPSPAMYERPVPDSKKDYGAFAGKYVNRQLYEAVMTANGSVLSNLVNELGGGLTGLFKTSAVLANHTALVTNFLTNFQFSAAAGLPPWNPMLYKRLAQAAGALRDFQRSALTWPEQRGRIHPPGRQPGGAKAWVKMAIEDGAVKPGFGREAGGSVAKSMLELYGEVEGKGLGRTVKRMGQLLERAKSGAGEAYDLADQVHRLAVYIEHVTQGRERLNLSMHESRVQASAIVNEFFASAADVGPGVKRVARNTGPLINPFVAWQVDNMRVGLNLARAAKVGVMTGAPLPGAPLSQGVIPSAYTRLFSGRGLSPALNVALYRMVVLGGLFAFLKRRYVISDPEEALAETNLRAGWAERNPSRVWLPFRDGAGRMQAVSLGQMDPWGAYLAGSSGDNWGRRIGTNVLKSLSSGSLSERWTEEVLARSGLMRERFEPQLLPGQAPRAVLEDAYRTFTPGTIRQLYEAGRRAQTWGVLGKTEERLTPEQASIRGIFGTNVEPSGQASAKASEFKLLGKEAIRRVQDPLVIRKLRETPERKGELKGASRERKVELREKRQEIRDFRRGGSPTGEEAKKQRLIEEILRLQGVQR